MAEKDIPKKSKTFRFSLEDLALMDELITKLSHPEYPKMDRTKVLEMALRRLATAEGVGASRSSRQRGKK
jgi:hypothetical protein